MEEKKKNVNRTTELNGEELDKVAGGSELESKAYYNAYGSTHSLQTCWQCGTEFWYAPGVNARNLNDPWKHFCSPKCKQRYEANHMQGRE